MIVSDQLYVYQREMRVTHRMAVMLMIMYIHVAPYLGIIFLCVYVCVCVCVGRMGRRRDGTRIRPPIDVLS